MKFVGATLAVALAVAPEGRRKAVPLQFDTFAWPETTFTKRKLKF